MNRFYEKLNLPNKCLIDSKIDKKLILEYAELLSSDKKIITNDVKRIVLKYSLKPDTINILPYKSSDRDYLEIEIIEVHLNTVLRIKRIAEIIMRSIPYPIILVLKNDSKIQLITGDIRKNLNDSSKIIIDDFVFTEWIDLNNLNQFDRKLFSDLNIDKMNLSNYYLLYKDITSKLDIYNFCKIKNEIVNISSNIDIRGKYNRIKEINITIQSLQKQINKESSMSERVEVSIQINKLKKEKENLLKLI